MPKAGPSTLQARAQKASQKKTRPIQSVGPLGSDVLPREKSLPR
jgi:hypothetical protein